ncbi:hypothetical protein LE631_004067 [Salmonella enterica]|nr:hypothetical protein [Salmonella enterica]EIF1565609.1 hypothetical protein [Salmonella enterica]
MRFKTTFIAISIFCIYLTEVKAYSLSGSVLSESTPILVGHRPEATADVKKLAITGSLTVGDTLTITNFGMSDIDGDLLDLDRTIQSVKWYLVENDSSPLPTKPDGTGASFVIAASATGKKVKVEYLIMTGENVSNPDRAKDTTRVLLTAETSGVTGGQADTGIISGKLTSVSIKVNKTPTIDDNGTDIDGTPIVGSTLTATLICDSSVIASECDTSNYDFQWQIAESGTDSFVDMTPVGATPFQHQVQGNQQNKLFRVTVKPKVVTP